MYAFHNDTSADLFQACRRRTASQRTTNSSQPSKSQVPRTNRKLARKPAKNDVTIREDGGGVETTGLGERRHCSRERFLHWKVIFFPTHYYVKRRIMSCYVLHHVSIHTDLKRNWAISGQNHRMTWSRCDERWAAILMTSASCGSAKSRWRKIWCSAKKTSNGDHNRNNLK